MSLQGFKKQFNKTSQYISEKVGTNKGSELDDDILRLGKKIDAVNETVEELQLKTKEYIQPNPSLRARIVGIASCQRYRTQQSTTKIAQPEYNLGEVFEKGGMGLEKSSPYATSLLELGSAFKELSEVKDAMEAQVQEKFICPLSQIQTKDLKDIAGRRKKLESRRLDYDYKRNKGDKVMAEVLQQAEDKFNESIQICHDSMTDFMENDGEHIAQLHALTESIHNYHKECSNILAPMMSVLSQRMVEANSQPRTLRRALVSQYSTGSVNGDAMSEKNAFAAPVVADLVLKSPEPKIPSCKALFDFTAENKGELEFLKGDIIELKKKLDANWLEGSINGKNGFFPNNFVQIIVPLEKNNI